MTDDVKILDKQTVEQARQRRLVAMHLQDIEDNPLDAEEIAMFEMFEREGWPHEKRRAYILDGERRRSYQSVMRATHGVSLQRRV